jgi:hypothetical protein
MIPDEMVVSTFSPGSQKSDKVSLNMIARGRLNRIIQNNNFGSIFNSQTNSKNPGEESMMFPPTEKPS